MVLDLPTLPLRAAPPPPAVPQQGGGMLSGLGGMVAQGMALGTGSALAHRAGKRSDRCQCGKPGSWWAEAG